MKNKKEQIKQAAAIEYTPGRSAPTVVAKGKGFIAEQIIEEAKKNNIPIHKDEELAQTLNYINIGDEITPELYAAVAQILVFVGDLDKLMGKQRQDNIKQWK